MLQWRLSRRPCLRIGELVSDDLFSEFASKARRGLKEWTLQTQTGWKKRSSLCQFVKAKNAFGVFISGSSLSFSFQVPSKPESQKDVHLAASVRFPNFDLQSMTSFCWSLISQDRKVNSLVPFSLRLYNNALALMVWTRGRLETIRNGEKKHKELRKGLQEAIQKYK